MYIILEGQDFTVELSTLSQPRTSVMYHIASGSLTMHIENVPILRKTTILL